MARTSEYTAVPQKLQRPPSARKIKGLSSGVNGTVADCQLWAVPDEGALDPDDLKDYKNRKKAIQMYLAGESGENIRLECGIGRSFVYRLVTERCLAVHPDGLVYGWRGIVRNLHINPYSRKKKVRVTTAGKGAAGAMQAVLNTHPQLRIDFEARILAAPRSETLGAIRRPRNAHWSWFLKRLREFKYEVRNEWPFNTKSMGYQSVVRYIDEVLAANPGQATRVYGGPDLEKKLISGDGVNRPITELFQRVEMDAHKLDGRFCVLLPQMTGGYIVQIVHRLWVIVILEVISRAVLGYYLSMRLEVSKEDVLRAIKKSLTLWRPKKLMFSDNAYIEEAGFPSSISEEFLGICWGETCIDGALAEKATTVKQVLKDVVGSDLTTPARGFSARRSKDDRPFIESFFRRLAGGGFQQLSNSTGSRPNEKQGRDPEKVAITSEFQFEYAEELLDVLIANYNGTPLPALGNRSPLEYISFVAARERKQLRTADKSLVQSILTERKLCLVYGGAKEGRQPYVNFSNATYRGDVLRQRQDLVGKYIWVVNHLTDDARVVKASTKDGQMLGDLRASPPWHKLPHSLELRRAICSCIRQGQFAVKAMGDATQEFIEFVENRKGKKLPVHPAYLIARQILIQAAESQTGQSMVGLGQANPPQSASNREEGHSGSEATISAERSATTKRKPLPSRRLAAS